MRARRWISSFGAAAVVAGGLAMAPAVPAAAADPPPAGITLDKKAPASVLLGDPVPYTLTASNPTGNAPLYNVSFSDVLPTGFEYVGPTDPLSAGEPTVTTTPGGQTLLVWNNVTDLQAASSFTLKFEAKPIPQTPPVDTIDPERQEHRIRRGIDQRAQSAEVRPRWQTGARRRRVMDRGPRRKRAPCVVRDYEVQHQHPRRVNCYAACTTSVDVYTLDDREQQERDDQRRVRHRLPAGGVGVPRLRRQGQLLRAGVPGARPARSLGSQSESLPDSDSASRR